MNKYLEIYDHEIVVTGHLVNLLVTFHLRMLSCTIVILLWHLKDLNVTFILKMLDLMSYWTLAGFHRFTLIDCTSEILLLYIFIFLFPLSRFLSLKQRGFVKQNFIEE